MIPPIPERLHALTRTAIDNGWSIVVQHMMSTGDHPFIRIRAVRGDQEFTAYYSTANTGTYRWGGAVVNNSHTGVGYGRVLEIMQEPPREDVR